MFACAAGVIDNGFVIRIAEFQFQLGSLYSLTSKCIWGKERLLSPAINQLVELLSVNNYYLSKNYDSLDI